MRTQGGLKNQAHLCAERPNVGLSSRRGPSPGWTSEPREQHIQDGYSRGVTHSLTQHTITEHLLCTRTPGTSTRPVPSFDSASVTAPTGKR